MSNYIFTTNIKCSGCESSVAAQFEKDGIKNWEIDLQDPERKLKITDTEYEATDIIVSLEKIGYQGILISKQD